MTVSPSEAVEAAAAAMAGADVAIACGGATSGEHYDRHSLKLDQHSFLIELGTRAKADGKPLAVLAMAPGQIDATWSRDATSAAVMFVGGEVSLQALEPLHAHVTVS